MDLTRDKVFSMEKYYFFPEVHTSCPDEMYVVGMMNHQWYVVSIHANQECDKPLSGLSSWQAGGVLNSDTSVELAEGGSIDSRL